MQNNCTTYIKNIILFLPTIIVLNKNDNDELCVKHRDCCGFWRVHADINDRNKVVEHDNVGGFVTSTEIVVKQIR